MARRQFRFHDGEKGSALAVRVKHIRGESSFAKVLKDGTIQIELNKAAGEVNERLIQFISRELDIPQSRIEIIAGEDGDKKLLSVIDMKPKDIQKMILELTD